MANTNPNLHAVMNHDGAVVLNAERGVMSNLNATGSRIWQALTRGETVEAIALQLASDTGEAPAIIEADIREFRLALCESGLLPDKFSAETVHEHFQ
jgi:hypothetical protein